MAAHAGDGPTQESLAPAAKDKRWPLQEVVFREPTRLRGVSEMVTSLEANTRRVMAGKDWVPPPMWYDPDLRLVHIDGNSYPVERVHYFVRARAALTKKPPPLDLDKYTLGKRA